MICGVVRDIDIFASDRKSAISGPKRDQRGIRERFLPQFTLSLAEGVEMTFIPDSAVQQKS